MKAEARRSLIFAKLAYRAYGDLKAHLGDMGYTLLAYVNSVETHTQGFVCQSPSGDVIVSFRGTEALSWQDWATDKDCRLVDDPVSHGKVHAGFLRAVDSCLGYVLNTLHSVPGRVHVTGHSLGAALATLVARRIHKTGRVVASVHTFGSPRVGDSDFAADYTAALGKVTYRHQYCCDVVTRVPSLLQGYRHVGQNSYYDADGFDCDDASLAYRLWDGLSARVMNWGRLPTCGIKHHRLAAYESALNN